MNEQKIYNFIKFSIISKKNINKDNKWIIIGFH